MDLAITQSFERVLKGMSLNQVTDAEELFLLRRRIQSDLSDAQIVEVLRRAFGWSPVEASVFSIVLHYRGLLKSGNARYTGKA
jgi:hypothetical protein